MPTRRTIVRWGGVIAAGVAFGSRATAQATAGADLNVSPKRIVFSPEMRSATVYVFNRGGAPATYNIGLVDRVMTPDGDVRDVNDPAIKAVAAGEIARLPSAQSLLEFTPRRVTLQPGQSQVIRVRALRPPDLAAGEYHTHLTVTTVPPEAAGVTAEEAANPTPGQVNARIVSLFSISIAVIVRQGPVDVAAGLDNLSFGLLPTDAANARIAAVSMDLLRRGHTSVYGDVEVRRVGAPKSSAPLGAARGVAVYTEVDRRAVQVRLSETPKSGERLEVVFKDDDTKPGQILATASLTVP